MPVARLEQAFARRMAPLSAAVAVIVSLVPPLSYWLVSGSTLRDEANTHARHLAADIGRVAQRQPSLWRYNAGKVVEATTPHRLQTDLGTVRIVGCDGQSWFEWDGLLVGSGRSGGPAGSAPIRLHGDIVAWVQVEMDPTAHWRLLWQLALLSALVGVALGTLIYLHPTRVVHGLGTELSRTVDKLRAAEEQLSSANRGLAERVRAAVREVRALSGRVVSIQEEERRRIARDLHDGVGQSVTALQLELELALSQPDTTQRRLRDAARACGELLAELRRVVRELRPVELELMPLCEALRVYTERFEMRTGIAISFRAPEQIQCSEGMAMSLLRILQEALTNVARHASAHEVGVLIVSGASEVRMEVSDDGVGFDTTVSSAGTGLRSMRERCQLQGGDLAVHSEAGNGVRLEVCLPLEHRTG